MRTNWTTNLDRKAHKRMHTTCTPLPPHTHIHTDSGNVSMPEKNDCPFDSPLLQRFYSWLRNQRQIFLILQKPLFWAMSKHSRCPVEWEHITTLDCLLGVRLIQLFLFSF